MYIYRFVTSAHYPFCVDAVSEWSKELALGASTVRCAGSNPVRIIAFGLIASSDVGWW